MPDNDNLGARARLLGAKPRGNVNLTAFVRTLDSAGTFELADVAVGPNGQGIARADRAAYLDADELVHMIRMAVREELAVFQLSIRKSEQQ